MLPRAAAMGLAAWAAGPSAAGESAEACLRAEELGVRFQCVTLYAEQPRDPALCARIENETIKSACSPGE